MDLRRQKWQKFLKKIWPFRFIPFVDFVFASGSLATGRMREYSDFDVLIGVKKGRIFTVRFFCAAAFGILRWRKARKDSEEKASDKFCFNHFVTPAAYGLAEPHNEYWKNLYLSLIPVAGDKILIQKFYDANQDWLGERKVYSETPSHLYKENGFIKLTLEGLLSGRLGDKLESFLKKKQIKRIKASLESETAYKPRIIFTDDELEFHIDTRRIEAILDNLKSEKK